MQTMRNLVLAILIAGFFSLIFYSSAWWFGDQGFFEMPESRAAAFVIFMGLFLLAASLMPQPELPIVLFLLLLGGPLVGGVLGFAWTLLVTAFGGAFSAGCGYYGMMAGVLITIWLFALIMQSFAAPDDAPVVQKDTDLVGRALRSLKSIKVGGQVAGAGLTVEAEFTQPTDSGVGPPRD